MKTTLGINIIARDGAEDLKELLPIVSFADEIVIVLDHRTTDSTKAICNQFNCKIIDYDWKDQGFCGARNTGIENTTSNYIAWFDCDDRPVNINTLKEFRKSNKDFKSIYTFQIRNVPGLAKFNQVRMFPNHPDVRFVYRIHETISHEAITKGFAIAPFDLVVDHHGYKHQDKYSDKLIRNLPLIEAEIKSGSFCPTLRYTYAMNLLTIGHPKEAEYWLRKNIDDSVKDSPFRDVYLFSILNVVKLLVNKKLFAEADHFLIKGMLSLPDFKEFHLLRAHISFHSGDLLTARFSIKNAKVAPRRDYAISTDWNAVDAQIAALEKAIG